MWLMVNAITSVSCYHYYYLLLRMHLLLLLLPGLCYWIMGQYLHSCLSYKMVLVNSFFLFPSLLWILCPDNEIMDSKSLLSPMETPPHNRSSVLPRCHFREVGTKVLGFRACGRHQTNEISPDTAVLPLPPGNTAVPCCVTLAAASGHRCGPFFSETKGLWSRGSDFIGHF